MGIEPTKKIEYLSIVNDALSQCTKINNANQIPKLYLNRTELNGELATKVKLDSSFHEMRQLLEKETEVATAVSVESKHPLYILHTSGTTGDPKGIVRDHGGTSVALNWSLASSYDMHPGLKWFTPADLGWVVGHTLICYGPLIRGCTSIIYEGKPITPHAGAFWQIVDKYKVGGFFTAPTAIREIMKHD